MNKKSAPWTFVGCGALWGKFRGENRWVWENVSCRNNYLSALSAEKRRLLRGDFCGGDCDTEVRVFHIWFFKKSAPLVGKRFFRVGGKPTKFRYPRWIEDFSVISWMNRCHWKALQRQRLGLLPLYWKRLLKDFVLRLNEALFLYFFPALPQWPLLFLPCLL